jgi:hypothetical protein
MSAHRVPLVALYVFGACASVANAQSRLNALSFRELAQLSENACDEFCAFSPHDIKATREWRDEKFEEIAPDFQGCIAKLTADVKKIADSSASPPGATGMSPLAQQLLDQTLADVDALQVAVRSSGDGTPDIEGLQRRLRDNVRALTEEMRTQSDMVLRARRDALSAAVDAAATARTRAAFDGIKSQLAALNGVKPKLSEAKINDALLSAYLAFRNVRNWFVRVSRAFKRDGTASADVYAHLVTAFSTLETTLKRELDNHDLTPSFAAELITGANVFQATGTFQSNPTPGTVQAAKAGSIVAPLAYLSWESHHYGSEGGRHVEFSVAGKFGEVPALVILVPKPPLPDTSACHGLKNAPGPCLSDLSAAYETALMASLSGRGHVRLGQTGEIGIRATVGESYLTSDSFIVGQGPGSLAALPVANGTGQAERFWETAVDVSIYGKKMDLVHATKDFLSPLFYLEFGFRNDNRFNSAGDLGHIVVDLAKTPPETVALVEPRRRIAYRFALGNIAIAGKDDSGPHKFVLSFGVEGDAPIHPEPNIPPSVRLFIRGDVNLLKSFTPSSGK